jgi:ATP-binding cassette, subfamily B, bacterial MsbA
MSAAEVRRSPWRLMFQAFAADRRRFVALGAGLIVVWFCDVALPYLLGETVDAAVSGKDVSLMLQYGLLMLAVIVVLYAVHVLYLRAEAALVARATLRLRTLVCERLMAQPLSFFANRKGGELGHRVMSDCEVLERHGVHLLADVPFAVLTVIGAVAVMLWMQASLALVVVGFLSLAAVLAHFVARPLATIEKSANGLLAKLGGRLQEVISGIRTVKLFGRERHEIGRLDATGRNIVAVEIKSGHVAAWLEPLIQMIEQLGIVVVVWYGAYLVFLGELTPGRLVAFIAYLELLSEPLQKAGRYWRQYQQARGTLSRIDDLLQSMPAEKPSVRPAWAAIPNIALDRVGFTYPGAEQAAVIDVSLEARTGDIIAIVGPNGAGKSTLVDILLGFHTPSSGRVQISDHTLDTGQESFLRQRCSVVSQDVFLFHETLLDNVRYGRLDATDDDVAAAIAEAGLQPLIARLPDGVQTVLGDRGTRLSGGERQRVALARMLIRKPDLIVLDEPTAALDGASMRDTNRIVRNASVGRITFVVAHRLQTIAIATKVLLMDQGRVVATGSIEELNARSELFRKLFKNLN